MIHFDLDKIKNNIEKLENETIQEGFWNDSKNSSIVLQQLKTFKEKYNKYNKLESDATNLLELNDILLLDLVFYLIIIFKGEYYVFIYPIFSWFYSISH